MNITTAKAGDTTTVEVTDRLLGITATGVSRCRPGDIFSAETGKMIAAGRAAQDWGRRLEAIGEARSVTLDEFNRVLVLVFETPGAE